MRKAITRGIQSRGNSSFTKELKVAIFLALICSLAGLSNLLFEPNNIIPITADGTGHMAKVQYIANCLAQGKIPSWFPAWYNGATATQYYPPLSYYLMVPIYWITNNAVLTFKINCISVMFIGGLGVWAFCYKKIGKWCGLVGIVAFCLQSFFTESLYGAGVVAQGPIFAMMPWFLLLLLECAEKPTRLNFSLSTILAALLILSHAMHAFMVCICTLAVLFIFVLFKKISFKNFFITACTIGFAGVLTAFWSIVGATGLENAGIPLLLPEASMYYTATLDWFTHINPAVFHYSIAISIMSIISIGIFIYSSFKKYNNDNQNFYCLAAIFITIFTTIFSFGMHIPIYKYLPMATSMVPGRILSFTAVTGAIASAYAIYMLWSFKNLKVINKIIVVVMLLSMLINMNPYKLTFGVTSSKSFDAMTKYLDTKSSAFDKGRYEWVGAVSCTETFFPLQYGFNTGDGWNIEGTPHNRTIWNFNIAFTIDEYDYVVKQLAYWNVRNLLLFQGYSGIRDKLASDMDFKEVPINRSAYSLYISDRPSSYFLKDSRNAIVIGKGILGIALTFPYITQGTEGSILDYSFEELSKYKTIYLCEPEITTITQKNMLEKLITQLVNNGANIIIESIPSRSFDIFGVHITDETIETTPTLELTEDCPWNLENTLALNNNRIGIARSIYGLDKVYANFVQKSGKMQNAVLGSKKVGKGNVVFLGAHLSQYLDAVNVRNYGIKEGDTTVSQNSEIVKKLYEKIFDSLGVSKTFLPETFDVTSSNWDYQGGSFSYNNDTPQNVTVSVTYAPRWSAKVDGKEIEVGHRENLITVDLPAGNHKVELHYGVTIYGKIGYAISCIGFVFFILYIIFFYKIQNFVCIIGKSTKHYLQF